MEAHPKAQEPAKKAQDPGQSEADKKAKRSAFESRTAGPAKDSHTVEPEQKGAGSGSVQAQAVGGGGKQQATADGGIQTEPLDAKVTAQLKASYGADLSDVVVRSGPGADVECNKRGCAAFALGGVITMSSKAGEKGSAGYQKILLHECAHVVQQRLGKNPDAKKGEAKKDAAEQPENAAAPGAPAAPGAAGAKGAAAKGADKGASTGAKEAEADGAAAAAGKGKKAKISKGASDQEAQHAPAPPPTEHENPNVVLIPLGNGRSISIAPPNRDGDWAMGVSGSKKVAEGINHKSNKWWRKSVPTPFFGLVAQLGIQVGMEFKLGEVMLNHIRVQRKTRDGKAMYEVEGTLETGMSLEGYLALTAGVSADAWIAEVGVGVKAKLGLTKSHPLSLAVAFGVNPATGEFAMNGKLSMAALELALKGSVGLFAYYDAIGVSTYSKDWWLYERSLGKLAFGGVEMPFGWNKSKGFTGKVEPKPFNVQDMEGNIRSAFPSKS